MESPPARQRPPSVLVFADEEHARLRSLVESGRDDAGALQLATRLASEQGSVQAEALRGLCLLRLGDPDLASVSAERVLSSRPVDEVTVSTVRAVLHALGRSEEATAAVEAAWQRAPASQGLADELLGACASDGDLLRVQQVALRAAKEAGPGDPEAQARYCLAAAAAMAAQVALGEAERPGSALAVAERLLHRAGVSERVGAGDHGDVDLLMAVLRGLGDAGAAQRALELVAARVTLPGGVDRALGVGGCMRMLCEWSEWPRLAYFAGEACVRGAARRGDPLPWDVWVRHLESLKKGTRGGGGLGAPGDDDDDGLALAPLEVVMGPRGDDEGNANSSLFSGAALLGMGAERSMALALASRASRAADKAGADKGAAAGPPRGACLALAEVTALSAASGSLVGAELRGDLLCEYVERFGASPSCFRDVAGRASEAGAELVRRLGQVARAQLLLCPQKEAARPARRAQAIALHLLSARLMGMIGTGTPQKGEGVESLGHAAAVATLAGEMAALPDVAVALVEQALRGPAPSPSVDHLLRGLALAEAFERVCGVRNLRLLAAALRAALGLRGQAFRALQDVPIRHIQYESLSFVFLDVLVRSDPMSDDFLPLASRVYDLHDSHAMQCADVVSAALLGGNFRKVPELARFRAACMASIPKAHFDAELSLRDAARLTGCLLPRAEASLAHPRGKEPDRDVRVTEAALARVRRAIVDTGAPADAAAPPPLPLDDLSVLPVRLAECLAGRGQPEERLFRRLSRLYCRAALALAAQGAVRVLMRARFGGDPRASKPPPATAVHALCFESTLEGEPSPSGALASCAIEALAKEAGAGGANVAAAQLAAACRCVLREFKARNAPKEAAGDTVGGLDGDWTAAGLSMGWTWAELASRHLRSAARGRASARLDALLWDSAAESEDLEQSMAGLEAVRVRSLAGRVAGRGAGQGPLPCGMGGLGADVDSAAQYIGEFDRENAGCPFMRRQRGSVRPA